MKTVDKIYKFLGLVSAPLPIGTVKITKPLEGETQRVGIVKIYPGRSINEQVQTAVNNAGYDPRDKYFLEEITGGIDDPGFIARRIVL